MPGLSHCEMQLMNAAKNMQRHWEITASTWRDKARLDFEKSYIEPLMPEVKAAVSAISEINSLLNKAIHECS